LYLSTAIFYDNEKKTYFKREYCLKAARVNTSPIVTRLFLKDENFTLLRDTCSSTKYKIFNTEKKAARDFSTWIRRSRT